MWWQDILANLVEIAFVVLIPVVLLLGRAFLRWLQKKLDFDIDVSTTAKLESILFDALAYAEEQALKAIKKGEPKPGPETKLETAIAYVFARVKELGLPELARDSVVKLLESKLNQTRPVV